MRCPVTHYAVEFGLESYVIAAVLCGGRSAAAAFMT